MGFGISHPKQAAELARLGAEGVIAGSRIISEIRRDPERAEEAVKSLVKEFVKALSP